MANIIASNLPVCVYDDEATNSLVFAVAHDGKLWPIAVQKAGLPGLEDAPEPETQPDEQNPDGDTPAQV